LYTFKAGLGGGSNNFAEILALKLLLLLVYEKGIRSIQVFGDSLLIINWLRGSCKMEKYLLRPIFDAVQSIKSSFNIISFQHVFRERNFEADFLSKETQNPTIFL